MPSPSKEPGNSGQAVRDAQSVIRQMIGDEAYTRALETVPAWIREEWEGAGPVGWVSVQVQEACYRAFALEAGRPLPGFQREVMSTGTERTYRGPWKILLRLTTDAALMKRTPIFYQKAFNVGVLSTDIPEPGRATITLREFRSITDFSLRGLQVGIETVLTLAGRRDVNCVAERNLDGAVITAKWKR